MDASSLAVRPCLDGSLPYDGRSRMVCLAHEGKAACTHRPGIVLYSTVAQCRMVSSFLRPQKSTGRLAGYRPAMVGNPGYHHFLREDFSGCGNIVSTVLALGRFCHSVEFRYLEYESIKGTNPYVRRPPIPFR